MLTSVAGLIELEHRRRRQRSTSSAVGGSVASADLGARGERVGAAMDDPDVILGVDRNAGDRSEHPVVRQRLRPERIDLEARRGAWPSRGRRPRARRRGHAGDRPGAMSIASAHAPRDGPVIRVSTAVHSTAACHAFRRSEAPDTLPRDGERPAVARACGLGPRLCVGAAAAAACAGAALPAHDIPADVTVQAFVQAGRPSACACWCACRSPRCATSSFRCAATGFSICRSADAVAARRRDAVDRGQTSQLYEGDRRARRARAGAASRVSLPSDRSFASFETALAQHHRGRRCRPDTTLVWNQALLDVLFEYPIASDRSTFSIRPRSRASASAS